MGKKDEWDVNLHNSEFDVKIDVEFDIRSEMNLALKSITHWKMNLIPDLMWKLASFS